LLQLFAAFSSTLKRSTYFDGPTKLFLYLQLIKFLDSLDSKTVLFVYIFLGRSISRLSFVAINIIHIIHTI